MTSLVAGDGSLRLEWDARAADGVAAAVAVFRSTNSSTLFGGSPVHTTSGAGALVVGGLANGVRQYVGLALVDGASFVPVGAIVSALPRVVVYVDDSSSASTPNGTTPASAFRDVVSAVHSALTQGGGNVWIAEGTYTNLGVTFPGTVSLYGGFGADLTLATRDVAAHASVLRGGVVPAAIEITTGGGRAILDGLTIEGGSAGFAIDLDSSDARFSKLIVRGTAQHGIRMRSSNTAGSDDVAITNAWITGAGGEGVSVVGTFNLALHGSRFSANAREGVSLGPLQAKDGVPASLTVRDCTFVDNGEDGLDCHLGAPAIPGGSSSYRVAVEGSRFDANGWNGSAVQPAGLRVDIEFDLVAGWSADILVRGSSATANLGHGMLLDLDATAKCFLHRVLASANQGDGLVVTSESTSGLAVVSTSAFAANLGAGLRASGGNVSVAVAHCVFSGNALGGLLSTTVTSSAVSSVTWLESVPFAGVRQHFDVVASDPLDTVFLNAPVDHARVLAQSGATLTLDDTSGFAIGDRLETADDGVVRSVTSLGGVNEIVVSPTPSALDLPASLARFDSSTSVALDLAPAAGSAALAAGMPAPAGPTPDAGVFGAPLGGVPGDEGVLRRSLFRASHTTPATTTLLSSSTPVRVGFQGGLPSSGSAAGNVRVRNAAGTILNAIVTVSTGDVLVTPPVGGWPSGSLTLELHAGLTSTAGASLAVPLALPFTRL